MITINFEKAKVRAHEIRRQQREDEFRPLDAIVMKQIKTQSDAAEAQRVKIRAKYAEIQTQIDAATTVDDLHTILGV